MEAHALPRTGRLFLPRSAKVLAAFSDERLVEQVRRGNVEAFEALYDRYHRSILAFCRHMLASAEEGEDAVQQTFISAHDALLSGDRDIRFKPWLYTIARNRCLSILRARREQPAELDDVPTVGLSDEVQSRAELRELLADVRDLPVDQRAALVLSELGALSHAEVGAVVGCEVAKVKSLVFQARSSLMESRKAREIPCHEIREQLATATGGALRRGPLRRHVRACAGCAEFRDEVSRQRKAIAAVLPVVPTVGLKQSALAAVGVGGGGAGGAAVGGAGLASLFGSGLAAKGVAVVVLAGVAVGGGLVLSQQSPTRDAEAADAAGGGGQAWPAPAAGTGPGSAHAAKAHPASVHARPAAAKKHGAKHQANVAHPHRASAGPTARQGGKQPGRRHAEPRRHHPAPAHPHPAPAVPAPVAPAPQPAPSHTDNGHHGDGDSGNHTGWTTGTGNPHNPDATAPDPKGQGTPGGTEEDTHGQGGKGG
jgi:RNA polymerase sigma factor (sigma-70 family)